MDYDKDSEQPERDEHSEAVSDGNETADANGKENGVEDANAETAPVADDVKDENENV